MVTPETLYIIDKRRHYRMIKNSMIQRTIRYEEDANKLKRTGQIQCRHIEYLHQQDSRSMHEQIRELRDRETNYVAGCLKSEDGKMIVRRRDSVARWTKYMIELYGRERPGLTSNINNRMIAGTSKGSLQSKLHLSSRRDYLQKSGSVQNLDTLMMLKDVSSGHSFQIGCNDMDNEGQFVWEEDGSELKNDMIKKLFGPGEPNNKGNQDCCRYKDVIDRMDDMECTELYPFVCEAALGSCQ